MIAMACTLGVAEGIGMTGSNEFSSEECDLL
jgi:hypothetical protein